MTSFPMDRHGLIHRPAALAVGISDDYLGAAVRRGDLLRVGKGVYSLPIEIDDEHQAADELHRRQALAVATGRLGSAGVLSHASAAAVHHLPTLKPDRERVHVTVDRSAGGYRRGQRRVHGAPLPEEHVTEVNGVAITSLERTAVDIAAVGDFAQGLCVFDAALRVGADRGIMQEMVAGARWGVTSARRALEVADGSAESVGESWSRAQLISAGLAIPDLQVEYFARGKTYRVDFAWQNRLVGEFDGKLKYGRSMAPGEELRDVLIREKRREDDLRSMNLMVIRWVWADLESGSMIVLVREWHEWMGLIAA